MSGRDRTIDFRQRPRWSIGWKMAAIGLVCFGAGFGGRGLVARAPAQDDALKAIDRNLADLNQSVLDVASRQETAEAELNSLNRIVPDLASRSKALLERLDSVARLAYDMARLAQGVEPCAGGQEASASDPMVAVAELLQDAAALERDPHVEADRPPTWKGPGESADSSVWRARHPMPGSPITEPPVNGSLGLERPFCGLCHSSEG